MTYFLASVCRLRPNEMWRELKKKNSHVDQIRFWNFVCDLNSRLKQALGGPLVFEMFAFYPVGNLINEPDRSLHTGFPALVADNRKHPANPSTQHKNHSSRSCPRSSSCAPCSKTIQLHANLYSAYAEATALHSKRIE